MWKHWKRRWDAWPRGLRWLIGGVAAVVLALALAWVLFVPAADWFVHHDVGSPKPALLQTARDAARGRLLTLGAGVFAAGALIFTARTFYLSQRTFGLTQQGQVTDRYTKAIDQLGSDKLDVRVGAIYALRRIMRDSEEDHPAIMEVLATFIRENSPREPEPRTRRVCRVRSSQPDGSGPWRRLRADIQAAITVIGLRHQDGDRGVIDLAGVSLQGAILDGLKLTSPKRPDDYKAWLNGVNFRRAVLNGTDLTGANLSNSDFTGATLAGVILTEAFAKDTIWPDGRPPAGWAPDPRTRRLRRA